MKYTIIILLTVVGLSSCTNHTKPTPEAIKARLDSLKTDLLKTDIAFSQQSEQTGRTASFSQYMATNATVLRPYSVPITGKDSIINLFKQFPDSMYKLTWVPVSADVALSGELGYTYGTYVLEIKDRGKEEGTYCTIWKKDKDNAWKFVMDTGNEGLNLPKNADAEDIQDENMSK